MPAAAARRARATAGRQSRKDAGRGRGVARAPQQSLEHRILLTATMCLLAFGAVMVYSASSATTLLQGHGYGSGYLIKFFIYGALGLVVMRVLARDGVAKVHTHHRAAAGRSRSCSCSPCTSRTSASAINGARRWIGPGQLQFQPSELMKLALVLYCGDAAGEAPAARQRPARAGQTAADRRRRRRACWSSPSPTSARRW